MDKYTQLQLEAITDELTNLRDRLEGIQRSADSLDSIKNIESIKDHLVMAIHELNHIND